MITLDFQTVAQAAAGRGLNTLLEGLALMGLSWTALRYSGARSSMTRFAVWFSTLLVIAGLPLLSRTNSPLLANGTHAPELTLSSEWAVLLFAAWAVIASVLILRLAVSLRHLIQLRRNAREIGLELHPALIELTRRFGGKRSRRIQLLVSDEIRVPTALGFFRPAVVLPSWALRDLSSDELKVIFLHELSHLRRWDDWTNMTQKFVKALFFFHPAVWWIDSRLELEREIACDDMVVEQTANARTYAASLVAVAEKVVADKLRLSRALVLAQSALGRAREVSQRIAQLLATDRPASNRGWRPALAIIGALSIITLGAMPYAPELISFHDKTQPMFAAAPEGFAPPPIKVTPVVFKQPAGDPGQGAHADANTSLRHSMIRKSPGISNPMIIAAKTTSRQGRRWSKLALAKASDNSHPIPQLLVLRSTRYDESDSTVWTVTLWQVRTANGEQRTLQETIVMNSL